MIELALSLAGHTHPRPLSEAFLHILRDRSDAVSVELHRIRHGDDDGAPVDELYAVLNAPADRGSVLTDDTRRLPVAGVGYVLLRGVRTPFSPPELKHALDVFGRSFHACEVNEREHRALRERELALLQALNTRTALAADVRAAIARFIDRHAGAGAVQGAAMPRWEELRRLIDALPSGDAGEEAPANRDAAVHRAPRARQVLLVDDFEPLRMVFRLQLESLGYEVEEAADGVDALRRWIVRRHDMVLTDLTMPGMGGIELTRALRFHEGHGECRLPVIGISGGSDAETLEQCRLAGMSDVLAKPVDVEVLERTLARFAAGQDPRDDVADSVMATVDEQTHTPVLDVASLQRYLGGLQRDGMHALVEVFLGAARHGLRQLRDGPDPAALRDEMHRQKSGARSIGALRYGQRAEALETALRRGEVVDMAAALDAMEAELAALVARSEGLDDELGRSVGAAAADRGRAASGLCVLVADDDPVIRLQLRSLLGELGASRVLEAGNGVQARDQLARSGGVDLILCDLNMPEMDGVELLRDLGRDHYAGAIALLSGEDTAVMATAGSLAAMHGLRLIARLRKPVAREDLQAALQDLDKVVSGPVPVSDAGEISADALLKGLARSEFCVYLQPQVDTGSGKAVGVEALARWIQADGTRIPPDRFIVAAERCGLIHELSEVLVGEAFSAGAQLLQAGHAVTLSVNLSAVWLDRLDLPDRLGALCTQYGLQPADVVLEVTETGVAQDLARALDILTRLRLRGFGLSIDDFGVGYSSFEQLRRVPFTELKLDRSFVSQSGSDEAARVILESTMRIAARLRLVTVAEGVETAADLELVRKLGCPTAQGYLFARPMDVAATIAWFTRHRAGAHAA